MGRSVFLPDVVAHSYNVSTEGAEAGDRVEGLPGLHGESLFPSKQPTPTNKMQRQRGKSSKSSKRSFWCQGQHFSMWVESREEQFFPSFPPSL
jgi:hypothetical protein